MFEWLKSLDLAKYLTPRLLVPALAICLFLLLSPEQTLDRLRMGPFVQKWYPGIVLAGMLSFFVLAYDLCKFLFGDWWQTRQMKSYLRTLTPPEQKLLRRYVEQPTSALDLPALDAIVTGLCYKGILTQRSMGLMHKMPTAIDPWALQYLIKNPHLVGLPNRRDDQFISSGD